jgi:hypothetical protein
LGLVTEANQKLTTLSVWIESIKNQELAGIQEAQPGILVAAEMI